MGHGIAQVFALAGHDVTIYDAVHGRRSTRVKARIARQPRDLGDDQSAVEPRHAACRSRRRRCATPTIVVEAVLEDLPLKQKLFAEIETACRGRTRSSPATPRSSRSPRSCRACSDRERALGTHWWNPPFLVPLVEVIGTQWTSPAAIDSTMTLHADAGKTPVHVKKDVPGFIGNRLQHALWREAISLVENGICDAETVDTVIKAAFGRRLAVLGPLENADLVGTDLTLAIHKTVLPRHRQPARARRPIWKSSWPRASSASRPARASAHGRRSEQAALRAKVSATSEEGARERRLTLGGGNA